MTTQEKLNLLKDYIGCRLHSDENLDNKTIKELKSELNKDQLAQDLKPIKW